MQTFFGQKLVNSTDSARRRAFAIDSNNAASKRETKPCMVLSGERMGINSILVVVPSGDRGVLPRKPKASGDGRDGEVFRPRVLLLAFRVGGVLLFLLLLLKTNPRDRMADSVELSKKARPESLLVIVICLFSRLWLRLWLRVPHFRSHEPMDRDLVLKEEGSCFAS